MRFIRSNVLPRLSDWLQRAAALCVSISLVACGGGDIPPEVSAKQVNLAAESKVVTSNASVIGLTKVSETRVSRTQFDYVFRITARNNSNQTLTSVAAVITRAGQGTTIIEGSVQVGDLIPGSTATPADTITLRHDRTFPFNEAALVWEISANVSTGVPGILLPGSANESAEAALHNYRAPRMEADLVTDVVPQSDAIYYRTLLIAVIRKDATVGQVNAALTTVGGRISSMWSADRAVTIQVPDPGTWEGLLQVAEQLKSSGAFESARPPMVLKSNTLPENITPQDAIIPANPSESPITHGPVYHQIAARVAEAWNSMNAINATAPVELIVVDYFGNGGGIDINGSVVQDSGGFTTGNKCARLVNDVTQIADCVHGYHVLGIINGSFGGNGAIGKVTGVLPKSIKIHIIDIAGMPKTEIFEDFFKEKMRNIVASRAPSDRFVLNMSLGWCGQSSCLSLSVARDAAVDWVARVDSLNPGFDYEKQVVQVSSAGNGGNATDAATNSAWNAAVLLNNAGRKLSNGLVVENRTTNTNLDGIPRPGPRAASTTVGGNIGAIGEKVYSFLSASTVGVLSGTSMATPQVAGLAAYMLSIDSTVSISDLVAKIRHAKSNPDIPEAPPIDAYSAVLSMDRYLGDNAFKAPARLAILQPNATTPKLYFDYADALPFLQAFFPAAYLALPSLPDNPNFSRFDLNGDGFTGFATKRAPFNLKFDEPIGSAANLEVLDKYPNGVPVSLDELAVTDFEVLCYYVNSSLFNPLDLNAFNIELDRISNYPGINRKISCSNPVVELNVNTTQAGWRGLPAKITISNLWATTITNFQRIGNSATNTCGTGERGIEPNIGLFSRTVASDAVFFGARDVVGVPEQLSGPSIGFRNCSSFYAEKRFVPTGEQVWINATGRARQSSGSVQFDWEYQVRYSTGDPTNGFSGKRCSVGVVPNSGVFVASFDSNDCSHKKIYSVSE